MTTKLNITNHILVPKHTKLSKKDYDELLNKYNISLRQLPSILSSDPAISHLDIKPGDIIKIERNSPTTKKSIFYRAVVHG